MTDSTWPQVGDLVRPWSGHSDTRPGPQRSVAKLTATQVVLDDDTRWRRDTLAGLGPAGRRYNAPKLHRANDPTLVNAERELNDERDRKNAAWDLGDLGPKWGNYPTEHRDEIVDAIRRAAPFLGLVVTDVEGPR